MSTTYHEPTGELSATARSVHRALATLIEELEAVDWYQQRIDVEGDEELGAILTHHRDEEIEHAAMALEWLRRRMPKFDEQLGTYLFTSGPVTEVEESAMEDAPQASAATAVPKAAAMGDLGIGKLKKGS
ncbi:MAG: ferritin-like domain-containing protein [Pirellulaceae bacterium]